MTIKDYTNEEQQYMQYIEDKAYIDPNKEVKYPPIAISMGNFRAGSEVYPIPIGTYGNFSFIAAPPKSKKTFFVSLLSAVYLKGKLDSHAKGMIGHRNDRCLVHFDTEQGRFHAQKVFRRVLDMTGLSDECYHTFGLRTLNNKDRLKFIEYFLYHKVQDAGLVVIDGIADLVSDVNNLDESSMVIQKLMKWTEELNCHIVTVIHSNYGTEKPTGHLGSYLEKKAETQIQLELNTVNDEMVTVKCRRSRGFPFDKFSFKINKQSHPEIVDDLYDIIEDNNINATKTYV
jgi:hypothetical protein